MNPWTNKPRVPGAPDYVVDYEHTEDFKRLEFILTEAKRLPQGAHILDLGCGTGNNARALAAAGFRVTGIDIGPHQPRYCSATYRRARLEHPI